MASDRYDQYAQDDTPGFDPLQQAARAAAQYTTDKAVTTLGSYDDFKVAGKIHAAKPARFTMGAVSGGSYGGGGQPEEGGGGDKSEGTPQWDPAWDPQATEDGEKGGTSRSQGQWSGHPDDYADATAGGRGGNLGSVLSNSRRPQPGLNPGSLQGGLGNIGQDPSAGTAGVGARVPRTPSSGSGGAALDLPIDANSWYAD